MRPHILFTLLLLPLLAIAGGQAASAQDLPPWAQPTMTVVAADGSEEDMTSYDGSAPMTAVFKANVQDAGNYTPLCEWRISRASEESPLLVRFEEETRYTFSESGSFMVELIVSFVQGTDTLLYEMDTPFLVTISESRLEVPNAFTPNGDGINDVFKVKEGYQSIVSFEAAVFSRWGKKLYEWKDIAGGWDGTAGGSDAPDGAYYLVLKARGADGRNYHFKKTINLLRGYTEGGGTVAGE